MFDSNADWGVDKGAVTLNESLFGNLSPTSSKHKKKKRKVNENGVSTNIDDNKSSMKKNKKGDASEIQHHAKKLKLNVSKDVENKIEAGAKSKNKQKINKDKFEEKIIPVSKKVKNSKDHQKKVTPSKEIHNGKPHIHRSKDSSVVVDVQMDSRKSDTECVKQSKAKRKRKSIESVSDLEKSESKKKKVKDKSVSGGKSDVTGSLASKVGSKADKKNRLAKKTGLKADDTSRLVKKAGDKSGESLTRKQKRNRRYSRTCSKNKYKHLSLSSIKNAKAESGNDKASVSLQNVQNENTEEGKSRNGGNEVKPKSELQNCEEKSKLKKEKKKANNKTMQSEDDDSLNTVVSEGTASSSIIKKKKHKKIKQVSDLTSSSKKNTLNNKDGVTVKDLEGKKNKKAKAGLKASVEGVTDNVKLKTPIRQGFDVEKLKEVLKSSDKMKSDVKIQAKKKLFSSGSTSSDSDSESGLKKASQEESRKKTKTKKSSESKYALADVDDAKIRSKKKESSLTEKMHNKLNAARFRYLNEHLYTTTGSEAAKMFAEDEDAFHVYHHGYQTQVGKWPVDPLDVIRDEILSRNKSPNMVIADMGCGSARLAKSLKKVKVHSFDLVAVDKMVTVCEMSKVPLSKGSVDVVVFCLSLMGTNLVDYLIEANRILKKGGIMQIAEVESRFKKVGAFIVKVEKLGFEIISKDVSNKMFYLFEFKKKKTVARKAGTPEIELEPCLYKKR